MVFVIPTRACPSLCQRPGTAQSWRQRQRRRRRRPPRRVTRICCPLRTARCKGGKGDGRRDDGRRRESRESSLDTRGRTPWMLTWKPRKFWSLFLSPAVRALGKRGFGGWLEVAESDSIRRCASRSCSWLSCLDSVRRTLHPLPWTRRPPCRPWVIQAASNSGTLGEMRAL